jgi:ubiquinone biosynthesis monooxygenase Coq7
MKAENEKQMKRRALIDRVLRVDHAGEYGARRIYEGQLAVLKAGQGAEEVRAMYEQELKHLATMERLLLKHRARPTLLAPLWHVGAYALGAATALLGKEAAMACTVAVETEIAQHYNSQLRELMAEGETGGSTEDMAELERVISEFRDDELHHLDSALEHGAAAAPGYEPLVGVVRAITRAAVAVAERV